MIYEIAAGGIIAFMTIQFFRMWPGWTTLFLIVATIIHLL